MPLWKHYYIARSIPDALQARSSAAGSARWIAGGTDLLLDLQQGRHSPIDTLVDVTAIPELAALEVRRESLFVGAAVPLDRIVTSPLVREHAQALSEACSLIGGPQVRNTATLGGNVAHALPAADGTIALLALDARAEIACEQGRRVAPLEELFVGPGRSRLEERGELLVGFELPLRRPGQASAFRRVMRPQGVALPILNLAVWLERDPHGLPEGVVADLRLSLGPAAPTPLRARAAEAALKGKPLSSASLAETLDALLHEASFRTSPYRAGCEYRRHLAGILLEEALRVAWERAGADEPRPAARPQRLPHP